MSTPSELREAIEAAFEKDSEEADNWARTLSPWSRDENIDLVFDAVIASLKAPEGIPRSPYENGYVDGFAKARELLQSAKSTSKESE